MDRPIEESPLGRKITIKAVVLNFRAAAGIFWTAVSIDRRGDETRRIRTIGRPFYRLDRLLLLDGPKFADSVDVSAFYSIR